MIFITIIMVVFGTSGLFLFIVYQHSAMKKEKAIEGFKELRDDISTKLLDAILHKTNSSQQQILDLKDLFKSSSKTIDVYYDNYKLKNGKLSKKLIEAVSYAVSKTELIQSKALLNFRTTPEMKIIEDLRESFETTTNKLIKVAIDPIGNGKPYEIPSKHENNSSNQQTSMSKKEGQGQKQITNSGAKNTKLMQWKNKPEE